MVYLPAGNPAAAQTCRAKQYCDVTKMHCACHVTCTRSHQTEFTTASNLCMNSSQLFCPKHVRFVFSRWHWPALHNFHLSCNTSHVSQSQHSSRNTGVINSAPAASRILNSCTFSKKTNRYMLTLCLPLMHPTRRKVCYVIVRADAHDVHVESLFRHMCPLLMD